MITSTGILSKLISFIVEKSASRLIALPFDKRKKACRTLTKLYYSIQCLDEATQSLLDTFQGFQKRGAACALQTCLFNHQRDIELASNMFMELSEELEPGLEIIDPSLSKCCSAIYSGKGGFLDYISNSITIDRHAGRATVILNIPNGSISSEGLEAMYQSAEEAEAQQVKHFWPHGVFEFLSRDIKRIEIENINDEAGSELIRMIQNQNRLLKEAKESLRLLLKDSFTIDEILFQDNSHPYR